MAPSLWRRDPPTAGQHRGRRHWGLLEQVGKAKAKWGLESEARVVSCYEAGRDGFWLHRQLLALGIANRVVDAASIEVSRRVRRAKTDRLDAQALLGKPIRYEQGERGVWWEVRVPSVGWEDLRQWQRERGQLLAERTRHREPHQQADCAGDSPARERALSPAPGGGPAGRWATPAGPSQGWLAARMGALGVGTVPTQAAGGDPG